MINSREICKPFISNQCSAIKLLYCTKRFSSLVRKRFNVDTVWQIVEGQADPLWPLYNTGGHTYCMNQCEITQWKVADFVILHMY